MAFTGQNPGPALAFVLVALLAAVVTALAAADRHRSPAAPDAVGVGALAFLGQLAVLVALAALGAAPLVAEGAALGLGLLAAYAAEVPGAG